MAEFIKVAKVSDVKEGGMRMVDADGEEICLIKSGGRIYAIDNHCTHEDGPLNEGRLEGDEVMCPWHDAKFNFKTGKADKETEWAKKDVRIYQVRIEGDDVLVGL